MQFTTSHEEKIFNEATYFVAVRFIKCIKTRAEFKTFNEAKVYGGTFGDERTMLYAVNEFGSSAHIMNC